MSCLVSAILLIALSVTNIASLATPPVDQEERVVAVTPVNLRGMPVSINTAKATETNVGIDIDYSITNFGTEPILDIDLNVFTVDSAGKVSKAKKGRSREKIEVGETKVDQSEINGKLKKSDAYFIAVNRVVTPSGVWVVEDADLASAVKTKFRKQGDADPAVSFQSHVVTTDEDRIQIFELMLRDVLDKNKFKILKDTSRLILLRDSVTFNLPEKLPANLLALNEQEIQALAEVEDRVRYLIYEPLTPEGSQVYASIVLKDKFASHPKKVRFCSVYVIAFQCIKKNGRWTIQSLTESPVG